MQRGLEVRFGRVSTRRSGRGSNLLTCVAEIAASPREFLLYPDAAHMAWFAGAVRAWRTRVGANWWGYEQAAGCFRRRAVNMSAATAIGGRAGVP